MKFLISFSTRELMKSFEEVLKRLSLLVTVFFLMFSMRGRRRRFCLSNLTWIPVNCSMLPLGIGGLYSL